MQESAISLDQTLNLQRFKDDAYESPSYPAETQADSLTIFEKAKQYVPITGMYRVMVREFNDKPTILPEEFGIGTAVTGYWHLTWLHICAIEAHHLIDYAQKVMY